MKTVKVNLNQIKNRLSVFSLAIMMSFSSSSFAADSYAAQSSVHSSQAIKYSALTLTQSAEVAVKVSAAVIAVPIVVGGGISMATGKSSLTVANKLISHKSEPLEICEETLIAGPSPMLAINNEE
jgi:hypothetical protein